MDTTTKNQEVLDAREKLAAFHTRRVSGKGKGTQSPR